MSGRKVTPPKQANDNSRWSDRELLDFAIALQRYGFGNTKKIALLVKTKSENAVKALIALKLARARKGLGNGRRGRKAAFHSTQPKEGEAEGWSTLRKWQKILQNQQMDCVRKVDYSGLVIPEIWERFRDEAGESPEDPQILDIGAMYGFIAECMRGRCPPDLPPKESAAFLMLMKFVSDMIKSVNLWEEKDFIKNFQKATTFVPFHVKDEFKPKEEQVSVVCPPGSISIPEDVHCGLSRHRKVVQSFNPMTVPVWLLEKEQNFFTTMFEYANSQS